MCKTLERLKQIGAVSKSARCPFEEGCNNSKVEEQPDGCKFIEECEVVDGASKISSEANFNYTSTQW